MRFGLLLFALAGLGVKLAAISLALVQVVHPADPVSNLITLAGAAASVFVLGAVKRTDFSIVQSPIYRKLQPFLALGGAIGLPLLAGKLGVSVDPQALINAPLATIISVGAAELGSHVFKGKTE